GNRTFENCSSLEYAIICCPMTTLPSSTFANCTALKWVAFQGTVTAIGGTAFYRCSSLEEIRFSGTEEQLRAITYPEGEAENNHKYFYQAKYTPWTTEQILSYEDPSEFGSGKTMPQVTLQDTISKIYDGTPAERLPLIITDVRSPITVTYRQGSKVIPSPPTAPGIYTVVLDFAETDTHFERRVSMLFEIKKDQGDILLSDPSLEKIEKMENGFPVTVPAFEVVGDGVPTILWYWGEQELLSPPTFAGQYRLVISLPETAYFMGKVIELECVISAPYKDNVWQGDIALTFAGGDGTKDNPYLISTPAELAYMAQMVNGNALYQNLHYRLTNDIYLNSELSSIEIWHKTAPKNSWTAIGTEEHPFLGTFDGQNHVIFGLYICGFDTYSTGLFGHLGAGSVVENLRITNSMVFAPDRNATAFTGILAAHADGATIRGITIDSCRLQAIRNASGGLLGAAEAQHGNIIIEDCHISFQFSQTDAELTRAFGGVIGNILGGNSSYYIALTRVEVEGYISTATTASGMIANAKGNAHLLFEDCENRATIEVAGSATGFCNSLTNTIVEVPVSFIRCQNNGKIISSENNASGFVDKVSAMLSKITFEGCESNGEIEAPCGIASGFICSLTGNTQQNASITFANCICYATPEGETSAAIIAKVTEKHPPISFYYCSIPRGTEAIAGEEMLPDGVTYPDYD
ncbi:MAG: leucine-rich repeat protein, partial [Clostridia bacterium]|nr:leucine-rich repeat protein [Clostridia bacterium]